MNTRGPGRRGRGASIRALAVGLGTWALAGPVSEADAQPKRRVLSRVVAVVDDECITSAELERRVQQTLRATALVERDPAARAERLRALRRQALDHLVDGKLVVAEAKRRGLGVTADEVEHALDTIQKHNGLDRAGLLAALREQGMDEATYRRELVTQLAETKLVREALPRVEPGWAELDEEAQRDAMRRARDELVRGLREARFVEVRS